MKNLKSELVTLVSKMDSQKIRLVMFVITLGLFALAAGAPDGGGGISGWR